jgi:hypothetical protein
VDFILFITISGILIILFICRSPFGKLEFAQSRFGLTRNIIHLYSTAFFKFQLTKRRTAYKKNNQNSRRISHGDISLMAYLYL